MNCLNSRPPQRASQRRSGEQSAVAKIHIQATNGFWNREALRSKVLEVNSFLQITLLSCMVSVFVHSQTPSRTSDCSTLKYKLHKVSCLCGTVQVCAGDICGTPSNYGLDDDIIVQLRDRARAVILDSKKVIVGKRERECTTQIGTKVACSTTERAFCFDKQKDGDYELAFVLSKKGVAQPAIKFPTNYSHTRRKSCDSVYMVEPSCPTAEPGSQEKR